MRILRINKKKLRRLRRILPSVQDSLYMLLGGIIVFVLLQGVSIMRHHTALQPKSDHLTVQWLPATVTRWQEPIVEMAKKYGIDPDLLAIIMTMESGGNPQAHSEADAQGLMQVTPPTAKDIAAKFLKHPVTAYDLFDPRTSIEFGAAYIAHLRDTFGEASQGPGWNTTVELIAAGYNGGPGAANSLEKGEGLRDMQTVSYSRDAYNMWRERHADNSPTFTRWQERGGESLIKAAH